MIRRLTSVAAVSALSLVASVGPAHAYLDPGAGSLVLQGLIGAIAGGAVMARTFWSRIVLFFGGAPESANSETAPASDGAAAAPDLEGEASPQQ